MNKLDLVLPSRLRLQAAGEFWSVRYAWSVVALLMGLSRSEVADQLERLTAHSLFSRCPRMIRFLRLCVERAIAGEPLKEFVVAVEVFDKKPDFDTRLNPLVRVEARRLRQKLRDYYAGDGRLDPVIIDLREGCYVPRIHFARVAGLAGGEGDIQSVDETLTGMPPARPPLRAPMNAAGPGFSSRPSKSRAAGSTPGAPAPAAPPD